VINFTCATTSLTWWVFDLQEFSKKAASSAVHTENRIKHITSLYLDKCSPWDREKWLGTPHHQTSTPTTVFEKNLTFTVSQTWNPYTNHTFIHSGQPTIIYQTFLANLMPKVTSTPFHQRIPWTTKQHRLQAEKRSRWTVVIPLSL
jgi:hypothetical protein